MKILIRGAVNPLEAVEPTRFIINNMTGGNIGNMLFLSSVAKTLMTDDETAIDYISVRKRKIDDEYIEYVNQTYDFFLIPLANAFKMKGHDEQLLIADFVNKLKIPCCIIGVGIQQMLYDKQDFYDYYPYKDESKALINAVLEKSPVIGVRGEMTADYLSKLGYLPEKDFTVIGCPSLFTYGDKLPSIKKSHLNYFSRIAFNSKVEFEEKGPYIKYLDFMKYNMSLFTNTFYLAQQINDMRMLYLDSLKQELRKTKSYDVSKALTFTNVHSWLKYYNRSVDFSVGTRLHGNIAGTLSGVPSLTIPYDKRVAELVNYHNLPFVEYKELKEDTTLYDLFARTDFNSVNKGHSERFNHYIDFLHKLGLSTVYDREYAEPYPFDKLVKANDYPGVIRAYEALSDAEKLQRYREAYLLNTQKLRNSVKQNKYNKFYY